LAIGNELKLGPKRLERIQATGLEYFRSKKVESIVESKRMASKWAVCKDNCHAALNDFAAFHLTKGVRVEESPVDWMDPMHLPIPLLGIVVLLRGQNKNLHALRDVITGFRRIQDRVKEEMYEHSSSEELNRKAANNILQKPMAELARFAGNKYNFLLFTSTEGGKLAPGMCAARHEQLMLWLTYIEGRVIKAIEEHDVEITRKELLRLPRLQTHSTSESDLIHEGGCVEMHAGTEEELDSSEEDETPYPSAAN